MKFAPLDIPKLFSTELKPWSSLNLRSRRLNFGKFSEKRLLNPSYLSKETPQTPLGDTLRIPMPRVLTGSQSAHVYNGFNWRKLSVTSLKEPPPFHVFLNVHPCSHPIPETKRYTLPWLPGNFYSQGFNIFLTLSAMQILSSRWLFNNVPSSFPENLTKLCLVCKIDYLTHTPKTVLSWLSGLRRGLPNSLCYSYRARSALHIEHSPS